MRAPCKSFFRLYHLILILLLKESCDGDIIATICVVRK